MLVLYKIWLELYKHEHEPTESIFEYTCLLQGCLSSWFRAHPDLLQAVLPIILDGLTNASQASSAALAFRDVCGECAEQLAPVVMQIIPACQVITVLIHVACSPVMC